MNQDNWSKHIERRSDLSTRITHLTRRVPGKTALEVLFDILDSKTLKGSTGYIVGNEKVVCFQEVPLFSLAENIKYEEEIRCGERPRYEAFGLRFNKGAMFGKGARPVVYGPSYELRKIFEKENYWRIVDMDLSKADNITDWTHEREWRVKGDLKFQYKEIEVNKDLPL